MAALGVTVVAGLAATAATVSVAGASGTKATTPPCTHAALQAGLSRGTATVAHAQVSKPFGCSGQWAYAAVDTKRFTLSSLFHARDGQWVTVSRVKPCADGAVPASIRKLACQSN